MNRNCSFPIGYSIDNTDCNDNSDAANPNRIEVCDGLDNDCNGVVDDDDAVLALCFASRGHAQSIGSIGEAFDEEVGDRATSVALIGGGVVGGAGDEREDGAHVQL